MNFQSSLKKYFITVINFFIICILLEINAFATPESRAAMISLLISPSTRVNGMGQAGVALTDESSGYYNPAAPAFVAKDHYFGITSYVNKMKWLPNLADDITYSYSSFQVGYNKKIDLFGSQAGDESSISSIPFSVSGAFSFYRTKLDLGTQTRTSSISSEIIGTFTSYEKADNFVFSAAVHSLIEIGAGITIKKFKSVLGYNYSEYGGDGTATGTAYDVGILARLPVIDNIEYLIRDKIRIGSIKPVIDISAGISWNNRGEGIYYIDPWGTDPLPANRKAGFSGTFGFDETKMNVNVFHTTFIYEGYTPQIKGVEINEEASDKKEGIEISILDTVDLRYGTYKDTDGEVYLDTSGFSIKSDGFFKYLYFSMFSQNNNCIISFILKKCSLSWTYFKYTQSDGILDDMEHVQISIIY